MFDTMTAAPFVASAGNPQVEALDALVLGEQAVRLEILTRIMKLEADEVWVADGATSMADWLAARYTTTITTSREWIKVARALKGLPHIKETYAKGRLSWDQLRALVRFANPSNDAEWAERAPEMTVTQLRTVDKTVKSRDVVEEHMTRRVEWWFHSDRPGFEMTVRMADTEGATLATWLTRRANQSDPNPQSGVYDDFETRCADALYELASQAMAED